MVRESGDSWTGTDLTGLGPLTNEVTPLFHRC